MWYTTEGGIRPKEVDDTISKEVVYLRKNIREEERQTEGETITVFVYEEITIPKDVYPLFAQQKADIDYLEMLVEG